jgi:hypothetical protein
LLGHKETRTLAGAITWYFRLQHALKTSTELSHAEALDLLRAHPLLEEGITGSRGTARPLKIPAGLGAAFWAITHETDPEPAGDFWYKLDTGLGDMTATDPVYVLRRTLIKNAATSAGMARLFANVKAAYLVKAWNAYLAGDEIKILRWTRGGVKKEPFPLVAGWNDGTREDVDLRPV